MDAHNYFEIFEIPVTLKPDNQALRAKFLELSRKYHPDFYMRSDPEAQEEALKRSALLNSAWKTFQDPDSTIRYVLISKGLMEEEEKYELPPDFLMEVLEINEEVMDSAGDNADLKTRIDRLQNEIYAPVQNIIENYSEALHTEKELLQVKDYYYKKRYLDRIRRELNATGAET